MTRRYCAVCQARFAVLSWQPHMMSTLSRYGYFAVPGQHYKGYPIVPVCHECREVITSGRPVVYSYRKTVYRYADGQAREWTRVDRLPLWAELLRWLQERIANKQPTTGVPEVYRELLRNDAPIRQERARLLKRGWRPKADAWQILEEEVSYG